MKLPGWLRRRVRRFDRRWSTEHAERERHAAVVSSRLRNQQAGEPRTEGEQTSTPQAETTSLALRER